MAVVIVIIPVATRMPAVPVLIPPPVMDGPAVLACLCQLVSPMVGLSAEVAVMLNGFVQVVIDPRYSSLAIVTAGAELRNTNEREKAKKNSRRKHALSSE